jgi:hypothetical protein
MMLNSRVTADLMSWCFDQSCIGIEVIRAWADDQINTIDSPPQIFIDLAFAKPSNVIQLLERVLGESDKELVAKIGLSWINRAMLYSTTSLSRVLSLYGSLRFSSIFAPVFYRLSAYDVEERFVELQNGLISEHEFLTLFLFCLEPSSEYTDLIPNWMPQGSL